MKYIFIHIGKTAGTSFREFLHNNVQKHYFGYGKLYSLVDDRDTPKFLQLEKYGYQVFDYFDLFSEHFSYGLHPFLKTKDYQYITMLREPIARIISLYNYSIDRDWISEDVNIIDWFMKQDNDFLGERKLKQIKHISGAPIDLPVDVQINLAVKNLKRDNMLFGIVEEYNEFIDLCCKINKWNPQYLQINTTKTSKEISEEDKNMLRIELADEINFYNQAKEIYNDKYKDLIND
tara:strand:+ start:151 stop:852 length:702 start_codon:yes stop_codon:yes gene_type:complete